MIDFSEYPNLCDYPSPETAMAADLVRGECGWHIAPAHEVTLFLDSDGGQVLSLPSLHVVSVSAVTDADDEAIEGWEFSTMGLLERTGGRRWPRGRRAVKVTFTHGLAAAPHAIIAVVNDIADTLVVSPDLVGVKQVAHDGASITYGDAGVTAIGQRYAHVLKRFSL
ncbi:hypothetical protein HYG77_04775 [Rhodococcus sp. ZPP]|uniref:hypothetical protein n=1 Tax=Rhodococcus sp. ZPP TaxID=2749906 RepID=UPI001AD875AA|nr:hypothetical protein [Rhodococcus sp. ZPP]QTJ64979.1 hypothetical protein HYG77_04775 [Rhodococcus sp. ZPP]